MTPKDIRIELYRRDIKLKHLADQLNCTINAVKLVIERHSVSKRIMQAVADAIEQDKKIVFPEYFKRPDNYIIN